METNTGDNDYLDVYMEGDAVGWLAVGFSNSSNMVRIFLGIYEDVFNSLAESHCISPNVGMDFL